MNIPTFKKGDTLSARKFNQLGEGILELARRGSVTPEAAAPLRWEPNGETPRDFLIAYRSDEVQADGTVATGWMYHRGRVIAQGTEYQVGGAAWNLLGDDATTGDIVLKVALDARMGTVSSATVGIGLGGSGTPAGALEFVLGTLSAEGVELKHGGGPVVIQERLSIVAGSGVSITETRERDLRKLEISADGGTVPTISVVAGPGVRVETETRADGMVVYTVSTVDAPISLVAGPGIIIKETVDEVGQRYDHVEVDVSWVAYMLGLTM